LGKQRTENAKLYEIVIEMMANAIGHAYDIKLDKNPKWYLIAMYDEDNKAVQFSFLDTGFGIPRTVMLRHSEKIKKLIDKVNPFSNLLADSFLIQSALEGEFRSETGNGYRGKGLPSIYDASNTFYINDLIIFSNKGFINCDKKIEIDLKSTFYGTLFSWIYK